MWIRMLKNDRQRGRNGVGWELCLRHSSIIHPNGLFRGNVSRYLRLIVEEFVRYNGVRLVMISLPW